ncbi:hypothetical protein BC829DRAFT_378809 [Chytridium lagenaria]|nr:hypothetical protein BC829DRAFT_378809 [Chytridium lagenaria]
MSSNGGQVSHNIKHNNNIINNNNSNKNGINFTTGVSNTANSFSSNGAMGTLASGGHKGMPYPPGAQARTRYLGSPSSSSSGDSPWKAKPQQQRLSSSWTPSSGQTDSAGQAGNGMGMQAQGQRQGSASSRLSGKPVSNSPDVIDDDVVMVESPTKPSILKGAAFASKEESPMDNLSMRSSIEASYKLIQDCGEMTTALKQRLAEVW